MQEQYTEEKDACLGKRQRKAVGDIDMLFGTHEIVRERKD